MKFKIKWKDDFLNEEWYRDNSAEDYLDLRSKKALLRGWLSDDPDLDSEAEIILENDD